METGQAKNYSTSANGGQIWAPAEHKKVESFGTPHTEATEAISDL